MAGGNQSGGYSSPNMAPNTQGQPMNQQNYPRPNMGPRPNMAPGNWVSGREGVEEGPVLQDTCTAESR